MWVPTSYFSTYKRARPTTDLAARPPFHPKQCAFSTSVASLAYVGSHREMPRLASWKSFWSAVAQGGWRLGGVCETSHDRCSFFVLYLVLNPRLSHLAAPNQRPPDRQTVKFDLLHGLFACYFGQASNIVPPTANFFGTIASVQARQTKTLVLYTTCPKLRSHVDRTDPTSVHNTPNPYPGRPACCFRGFDQPHPCFCGILSPK